MSEWQDISTAPKDGTVIMLYGPDEATPWPASGRWDGNCWEDVYDTLKEFYNVTHWQPLPPPPTT